MDGEISKNKKENPLVKLLSKFSAKELEEEQKEPSKSWRFKEQQQDEINIHFDKFKKK